VNCLGDVAGQAPAGSFRASVLNSAHSSAGQISESTRSRLIEAGQSEPRRCCHALFVPWSDTYYPPSMKNLPPAVRRKAIEIANALLRERCPEGQAIRIAIARAKQWALQPGRPAHRA